MIDKVCITAKITKQIDEDLKVIATKYNISKSALVNIAITQMMTGCKDIEILIYK